MAEDDEARQIVEKRMGSAFARKATPTLLRALTAPVVAGPEAMGQLAFPETASVADIVNPSVVLEIATGAATEAVARGLHESSSRQRAIAMARGEFEFRSSAIRERLQIPTRESGAPPRVETCWLANAVRVRFEPRRLAEVAEHDDVEVIDVPRPIRREQIVSVGAVVRSELFRNETGLTGRGVLVAVIDGEALRNATFFQDRLDSKNNFSFEPWGHPDDHGTAVAAIVGANSSAIVGMAPEALIHNYKVFPLNTMTADDFDGELAIQQALEDSVQVANCSWGAGPAGSGTSREARACDRAWGLGMAVVKSAGNRGPAMNSLTRPADAFGVIVVGGTIPDGTAVGDYSSRGTTPNGDRPHLVAPGGDWNAPLRGLRASGLMGDIGYGTSFAAPHVTGALALLLERTPTATPDDLRAELIAMCRPLADTPLIAQGAGLLQLR